ncbi:DUF2961 domain-containing protein, partial [Candidatus Sumerlaeota bacterium]|nr:DUF2961 domain-containing protein [Candidatus Sumerlaeota bacterium]
MRGIFVINSLAIMLILASCSLMTEKEYASNPSGPVSHLAMLKDYKTARVSSEDRQGNRDSKVIDPHSSLTLAELEGPGEITHIWVTIATADPNHLRNLVLRIYWDGNVYPSVETPIGDFFGLGHAKYYDFNNAMQAIGTDHGMNSF